jgi:hypothetical protein
LDVRLKVTDDEAAMRVSKVDEGHSLNTYTIKELLGNQLSDLIQKTGLENAEEREYLFNLYGWKRQLADELKTVNSKDYQDEKDYDDRIKALNLKIKEIDQNISSRPVSNAAAKDLVEWNETLNNGQPIDWAYWKDLNNLAPAQAAKLAYMIDPILWPDDTYAGGKPYNNRCSGERIDKDLSVKIQQLKQRLANRSLKWNLVDLVDFLGEDNVPFGMLQATTDGKEPQVEPMAIDGAVSDAVEPASMEAIQVNSKDFDYSGLLNEPAKKDDWFRVIDDMTRDFHHQQKRIPNETQAWAKLWKSPPVGYEITTSKDRGDDCLKMPGSKSLNKRAFNERWKKYTASG